MTSRRAALRLGPLAAAALLLACSKPGVGVIALEGATLVDGNGGPPVRDALILVKGGRITQVGQVNDFPVPRGAQEITLTGKTIIPGLIDAHAHAARWAGTRFLAWGVTTIRDFGTVPNDSATALRDDWNLGSSLGPRVYTSGAIIDGAAPRYAAATVAATPDEARRAIDALVNAGAEFAAAYTKITPPVLTAMIDEATALKTPVAVRPGLMDARAAAKAGAASLEGLSGVVAAASRTPAAYTRAWADYWKGWTLEEKGWAGANGAALDALARELAASRTALVPLLVQHETAARLADTGFTHRAAFADLPAGEAALADPAALERQAGWSGADVAQFARGRAAQNAFVMAFRRAGGLVGCGSGAPGPLAVPGEALHEELALMVAAGFSPAEAIVCATRRNAQLVNADSLGVIEAGKLADLVVLNGDPTQDIAHTRDIAWVMTRGRIVRPDSLRIEWKKGQ